jgi:hypothetical protein
MFFKGRKRSGAQLPTLSKRIPNKVRWNHHSHNNIRDAANYIAAERDRQDLGTLFAAIDAMHVNFYEHQMESWEARVGADDDDDFDYED